MFRCCSHTPLCSFYLGYTFVHWGKIQKSVGMCQNCVSVKIFSLKPLCSFYLGYTFVHLLYRLHLCAPGKYLKLLLKVTALSSVIHLISCPHWSNLWLTPAQWLSPPIGKKRNKSWKLFMEDDFLFSFRILIIMIISPSALTTLHLCAPGKYLRIKSKTLHYKKVTELCYDFGRWFL